MVQYIQARPHYPFVTRLLIDLFNDGELSNVKNVVIEPVYGYAGRIEYKDGSVHLFKWTNLGVNRSGASEISKDKGYTKFFLRQLGYKTPEGEVFLMPTYLDGIAKTLSRRGFVGHHRSAEEAYAYAATILGYPCYVKPNFGSQGRGIRRCENPEDLEEAINTLLKQGERILLLEKAVNMPDFRIIVFREEMISCYRRIPLNVVGDDKSTIEGLLIKRQEIYVRDGRDPIINLQDPRILRKLLKLGMNMKSVPTIGEKVQLLDVSNLSLGGESEEYTHRIHQHWKDLSIKIALDMGLKLCGVDLACTDLEEPQADYSVLEVNAAPGLDNYAANGEEQARRVRDMYKKVFNELSQN